MTDPSVANPLQAFRSVLGRLPGPGEVALVVGKAGVGKSALLVNVALDALRSGERVLHVALRETVEHTRVHYDEILRAFAAPPPDVVAATEQHRMILSLAAHTWDLALVTRHLDLLAASAGFVPAVLVIDGFAGQALATAALEGLRALARERNVVVWVGVRADHAVDVPEATVVRLVPDGRIVRIVMEGPQHPVELQAVLDPTSLRVVTNEARLHDASVPPHRCTLYAGGAEGAEAAFGEAAERWGVHEVNFTFEGHRQARVRGRYALSVTELAAGDVSLTTVSRRLNRTYNDRGGLIRGVLQTLWHMVSRSEQVFVVGVIQPDGTVVGGTGWGVELARMWNRELWVYDQERRAWVAWDGQGWVPGLPRITSPHVCGTGTRYLDAHGRAAIDALFDRSFHTE